MNRSRIIRYDDAGIFYEKMAIDSIRERCQTNGTFSFFGRIKMDNCQVLPGGILLGPHIAPMTAEEETAARKRVAETLERIAARKQSEQKNTPDIKLDSY